MLSTKKMNKRWLPFLNAKPYVEGKPAIISSREVPTVTKNHCKLGAGLDDKIREEPVDWYGCQASQNENGASGKHSSACISKYKKQRRHCRRNVGWNGYSSWLFFLQNFLIVYATWQSADSDECALGIKTPGRTWPKGNIVLEHGQSLRIYCTLNEILPNPEFQSKNASDLVFFRDDMLVESEYITVVNKTTIMLYVDQPSPSEDMYVCKLKRNVSHNSQQLYAAVCLNKVIIGFKPKEPLSLSCVSHNWRNLTCTWEPAPNYVETRYSLNFRLSGRAGGRMIYSCPMFQRTQNLPPNTCFWDITTDPMYRQVYEYYTFILNAENVLGKANFIYKFHHWAHVIPSQPVDLSIVNKTSSSALLYWKVPVGMANFPPGLYHRISYRNEQDPGSSWQTIDINDDVHANKKYFNITDLQDANAVYEVRVFLKSAQARGEDKWSRSSSIIFKTAATLPGVPPRTDIGSFDIVRNSDSRDVYIYWQAIPARLENGDNFTYQIVHVEENGHSLDLHPYEMTKAYALFEGISLNRLTFDIVAANLKGLNEHKCTVHVPSQLEIPPKPVVFTKIVFDGGIYELSWNSLSSSDIVDYTIFWCENDRDRPYQCSGYLDWVHVPRDIRMYNVTVSDPKKVYQFAIAANTAQSSSGMAWASGMTSLSDVVGKMKSVWITRIKSNLVEVGWELEYSGRIGVIESFNINHCPIVSAYNLTCDGPKIITTVRADPYMLHGVVRNLKPQTTYLITVVVVTKNGKGLHSDALYVTTLETTLDPVLNTRTPIDIPPKPASVLSDVNVSTAIEQSSIANAFGGETKQVYNGAVHFKANRIAQLDSDNIDCITQMNNWTQTISVCEKKFKSVLDENRQLREIALKCNEIW